ncbi:UPF0052 domain protein [Aspergillus flavus AF70]|nr:UPF0052 domain protein [Aspergillus flavus AF70]
MSTTPTPNRGIAVFSGGSAANNLVEVFEEVRDTKNCPLSYIIPISDNGGSSSELIRIFGGPGIGDVRSRLVRLIPESPPNSERGAIKTLFNHRLSADAATAHAEWLSIVDGTSNIWHAITPAKKELIRSFFNLLNLEILKRARPPSSTFDFTSASVGNLFLTGARLFSGSFESAIYLLGSICGVPSDTVRVIPAINSNFSHHISASLANGSVIVGQNSISHPSEATALQPRPRRPSLLLADGADDFTDTDTSDTLSYEDDHPPGSLPTLRNKNIKFSKAENEDLPSRITRIWYINPYGQEIRPPANPRVLEAIRDSQAIIYSIGSLYTSLIPSLILRGVGQAIVTSPARHKILILNGSLDRETGPPSEPFTAVNFVEAITRAGEESRGRMTLSSSNSGAHRSIPSLGLPYSSYVTHILHLEGPGTPQVDRDRLAEMGIETLRLYGRKIVTTGAGGVEMPIGMKYDATALVQALEVVLGKKGDAMLRGGEKNGLSRRNTIGRVPLAPDNTQVDFERAILGCQLADTEWEGRVDGFLRTQEVQEIILCYFERDLELTQVLRTKLQDDGYNSRYDDLAVGEVTIDFDHFVTAYEYGLDLFPGASKLPCLSHIPTEELEPIRRDVKHMILTREPSRHAFDWKVITDKIISQYSSVLQDIAGDYGDYYNITSTVERCQEEFLPISAPSNTLASKAVRHVTGQICSTLASALLDFDLQLEDVVNNIQGLILYLEWTAFAHRRN